MQLSAELQAKLQRAAQDAEMVQNACNLSGVARSFREVLKDVLWPVAQQLGKGTARFKPTLKIAGMGQTT